MLSAPQRRSSSAASICPRLSFTTAQMMRHQSAFMDTDLSISRHIHFFPGWSNNARLTIERDGTRTGLHCSDMWRCSQWGYNNARWGKGPLQRLCLDEVSQRTNLETLKPSVFRHRHHHRFRRWGGGEPRHYSRSGLCALSDKPDGPTTMSGPSSGSCSSASTKLARMPKCAHAYADMC
jgi:hypothetical protein